LVGLTLPETARLQHLWDIDDDFIGRHPPISWSGPVNIIGRHQQQPCKSPCFAISSSSQKPTPGTNAEHVEAIRRAYPDGLFEAPARRP